jgi:hypothetical protein
MITAERTNSNVQLKRGTWRISAGSDVAIKVKGAIVSGRAVAIG